MVAVEIESLTASFPGLTVFENVSIKIDEGDFVAIVGPNGSGKSTLLKMICKIIKPKQGSIKIFDEDIKQFKNWHDVAYISQTPVQQNRSFPVVAKEVVAMGLLPGRGFSSPKLLDADKDKVKKAIEAVGMNGYENTLFGRLSGGQRQKILLARALITGSRLLLLDEPTSGIDIDAKQELYELLKEMNESKKNTIIMVSHDMELAARAAKKVLCLEQGGVCYWGTGQDMMQHRHRGGYYFGCACAGEEHGHASL